MGVIWDIIVEAIWELLIVNILGTLFRWTGAFIRWTFTGFRGPLVSVLDDDRWINGVIGFVMLVGLGVLAFWYI